MQKKSYLSTLCLLSVGIWACASRPSVEISKSGAEAPFVTDFQLLKQWSPVEGLNIYHYKFMPNSLEVVVIPRPQSGVIGYVTAFRVGSRQEVQGRTGIAHLFEHLMFRGTPSFPNPMQTLSRWGGDFNAFTSFDVTLYHEVVPKELFDGVLKFESERMRSLAINDEKFHLERGAVISERKMRVEDNPAGRARWEIHRMAYDHHPYKTTPIGWQEDLDATSFTDAMSFYNKFYAPNQAVIAIAGDITVEEALKKIRSYYGELKAEPKAEEAVYPAENYLRPFRRRTIPMKIEGAQIIDSTFGYTRDPSQMHKVAARSLMCTLWADSKYGYLAFALVEKGIAQAVSSGCEASYDRGLDDVSLVAHPRVNFATLEKAYEDSKKGFLSWVKKEQRLEKIKQFALLEHWKSLRKPISLSQQVGFDAASSGDPFYSFKLTEELKKVSLQDITDEFKVWTSAKQKGGTRLILVPSDKTETLGRKDQL